MLKRAIVVGASSGIGAGLVRRLCREGYRVAAVARRKAELDAVCDDANRGGEKRAIPFVHDVHDTASVAGLFADIVRQLDGVDLVVYAAGVMPKIDVDQFDTSVDAEIVAVNVTGAMAWCNAAAERFLVQKGGMIVGVGSVAGDRGRIGNPAYCASKAALHTYLEALRNRLTRHGVHVLTVKPGPVRTPMTEKLDKLPMMIDVDTAVEGIWRAIVRKAQVAYVPAQWSVIMPVIQSIPSVVFRRMSI